MSNTKLPQIEMHAPTIICKLEIAQTTTAKRILTDCLVKAAVKHFLQSDEVKPEHFSVCGKVFVMAAVTTYKKHLSEKQINPAEDLVNVISDDFEIVLINSGRDLEPNYRQAIVAAMGVAVKDIDEIFSSSFLFSNTGFREPDFVEFADSVTKYMAASKR